MARPRRFVNEKGKVVGHDTGVSYHVKIARFYTYEAGTSRKLYFKTWAEARDSYLAQIADDVPSMDRAKMAATADIRRAEAIERIAADPALVAALSDVRFAGGALPGGTYAQAQVQAAMTANRLADTMGVPGYTVGNVVEDRSAGGPKLSDVIVKWREHKNTERDLGTRHKASAANRWAEFVRVVGNVRIAALTPEHFRLYHGFIAREGAKRSPQWQRDRLTRVKGVLRYVRRKYPEWNWPAGCLEWADAYDVRPHKVDPKHREPMTPADFKALIAQCRVWAAIDPARIKAADQSGRAKRQQAQRKQRDGVQFEPVLRLGVNAALDPIDIARVTWADIKFDTTSPHLALPRHKMASTVGREVERLTPLLPTTVEALKIWQTYEGHESGRVFRSSAGGEYNRNRVGQALKRLAADAGVVGVTFKMLRNVGPTLGKKAKLSRDERDALLGHVVNGGTSVFYEGDMDHHYLVPLVNLIGAEYFGGDAIAL